MSRTLRPKATLTVVALAMVALICAGCSSAPAASGSGGTASYQKAVNFAQCIRGNGVSEFPDPDASGNFSYGIKGGSSMDPSSPVWQKAVAACKDLEPAGFAPKAPTDKQIVARLKFAQCMRSDGVKDFPDPANNGPLINVKNAHSIPGFQAALQKCRPLMTAALK
jgi:hypothetical protein